MLAQSRLHLVEARESYGHHLMFAGLVGAMLAGAGLACILHALVPGLCRRTASQTVQGLTELFRDRSRLGQVASAMSGSLVLVGLVALAAPIAILLIAASGQHVVGTPLALITLAVPAAYLWSNPELNPVG